MWRMIAALIRQRRRLLLATVAIALSVGYLAGALTLLDRVSEGLSDLAAAGAERADLVVEGDVAYESALEQTRRLVPSSIAESLQGQPGIAAAVPRIEEVTILLGPDYEPIVAPGLSEQPMGANWPDDEQISPYRFVGEGRPPEATDEVGDNKTSPYVHEVTRPLEFAQITVIPAGKDSAEAETETEEVVADASPLVIYGRKVTDIPIPLPRPVN